MPRLNSAADLERLRQKILSKAKGKRIVSVTNGTDGRARGSQDIIQAFVDEIKKHGLKDKVEVKSTGCHGFCEKEPIVLILPEETCYVEVKPEDVPEIVSTTLAEGKIVDRLLYQDPATGQKVTKESEIPFYQSQNRAVLGNNRFIDVESIDDYIALGGYSALAKVLFEMTPEEVLNDIKKANLRGRGGGGFPAGRKWETTRNAPGDIKYVIVNAHEGEPGAFMDRALLLGNPHSVLEGLIIGAYAIGSHDGFIYLRHDSPITIDVVTTALAQAEEYGLLGENILGSGFNFSAELHRDIGIFVSGESSALMTAIEGAAPEPRPKYIHTSVSGIWQRPTNLNNVETWANVPLIIDRGVEWFTGIGTEGSKGTKIISLAGNINNVGLIEVPMGVTLRKLIYDIGGGIPNGKKLKAVYIGGPLGGCVPESRLDLPVDFDELWEAGAPIGAGSTIVMDETNCMVDIARYFLDFLTDESCGKCIPCREGIFQMLKILNRICEGNGREGDIELLEEISAVLKDACLCALGQTAPNPIFSTIRYFRDEYDAHIKKKRCPAGVCKMLTTAGKS